MNDAYLDSGEIYSIEYLTWSRSAVKRPLVMRTTFIWALLARYSWGSKHQHRAARAQGTGGDNTMQADEAGPGRLRLPNGHMTKTALAVEALRAAILRGDIAQDQPLTVGRIAAQLGMSPTPVREAMRTLQAEGLLRHEPHHSVSVTQYSPKDIHDIFRLRADLESQAIRLAVPALSEDDIARLDALQREMVRAAAREDIESLNRLNAEWHLTIYSAADNRVLLELVQHLWKQFMWEGNWITPDHAARSLEQHAALLAAIHARDADLVERLMREHIEGGERASVEYLEMRTKRSSAAPL
jgi:DNA-binding GntR family transcriptional regulator